VAVGRSDMLDLLAKARPGDALAILEAVRG
jgi:hypothetical protein